MLPVAGQVVAALQDEAEEQDVEPPADGLPAAEQAFAALQAETGEQDAESPGAVPPVGEQVFAALQDEAERQGAESPGAVLPVAEQVSAELPDGPEAAEPDDPPVPGEPAGLRVYSDVRPEARGDFRVQADGPVEHLAARSAAIALALPARVGPPLLALRQADEAREPYTW